MNRSNYWSLSKSILFGFLVLLFIVFSKQSFAGPSATASGTEWKFPSGTPEGTRYSSLDQINSGNVGALKEQFTISTGVSGGHQGQPIVINIAAPGSTPVMRLFFMTPSPNLVKAVDLSTGLVLWTYTPSQAQLARGQACCDVVNRGLVYSKGKIVFTTLSGALYALDANTGALLWNKSGLASVKTGETVTGAPLVIEAQTSGQKDLVIIGSAGAENGVRGWTQALDLNNKGASVWKFYNTGSDVDVGITSASAMPTLQSSFTQDDINLGINSNKKDLGCTSWGDVASTLNVGCSGENKWKQGGATVWAWITNDPSTRTLYYGTANPGVWNASMRPGSNKWASSIFARNVDNGQVIWVNQITPHDGWDYDSMNESILVKDTDNIKKLVHFDKNGFAYKFNAITGVLLDAKPFSDVTWVKRLIDGSIAYDNTTKMPIPDPAKVPIEGVNSPLICPSPLGAKEFSPASYSEVAGLFFVPSINFCSNHLTTRTDYIPATPFVGDTIGVSPNFNSAASPVSPMTPYGFRSLGELIAWNPNGTKAWSIPENNPLWGGVLSTKGNLVFYGTLDKHFKAIDSSTGMALVDKTLECGVLGNPITFVDSVGNQKVAVFSGVGWLTAMFTPDGKKCPGVLHIFGL